MWKINFQPENVRVICQSPKHLNGINDAFWPLNTKRL